MASLTSLFRSLCVLYILNVWAWAQQPQDTFSIAKVNALFIGNRMGQCFPSFCPCILTARTQHVPLFGRITANCLHFCRFASHIAQDWRLLTLICISTLTRTHSCKGMHVLSSHLVSVAEPLSVSPHPSKMKRAVYVFTQRGSIFFFSLFMFIRRVSMQPDQGTELFSSGQLGILFPHLLGFRAVNNATLSLFYSVRKRKNPRKLDHWFKNVITFTL